MAADRVDGLDLAPVALGRTRVQQHPAPRERRRVVGLQQRQGPGPRDEVALGPGRFIGGQGAADRRPGGQTSVEHPDGRMSRPAQQPPRARRRPPLSAVVRHYAPVLTYPGPAHRGRERGKIGQGVAAGLSGRGRELGVEIDVDGTRQMPRLVCGAAGRPTELPAHIEQERRLLLRQLTHEIGCGDDGMHRNHPCVDISASIGPPGHPVYGWVTPERNEAETDVR
ncbi:hypothetical protein GCM10009680_76970 [Streptomyces yatensis]|uniref:Uncharacterized protein n=1 Tax=Streptomyces yatensis TaxID=155177 RepID=A0ABN2JE38_9ACTN